MEIWRFTNKNSQNSFPKGVIYSILAVAQELIARALKPGGTWYMSFKYGEGERWDSRGHFFADHSVESITNLLQKPLITLLEISTATSMLRNKPQKWLNVFCRKK
jgi:hypothetical protein